MAGRAALVWTDIITITTAGTLIQRGTVGGSGVIPDTIGIRSISIWASDLTKQFYVRGMSSDSSCNWVPSPTGQAFPIEGLSDECRDIMYVKAATGTMQLVIAVKGV
jgi:hypothetical protein